MSMKMGELAGGDRRPNRTGGGAEFGPTWASVSHWGMWRWWELVEGYLSVAVRNWTTVAARTEPAGWLHGGRRMAVAPRDRDAEASAEILRCRVDVQAVNGCPQAELGSRGVALETTIAVVDEARREDSAACGV